MAPGNLREVAFYEDVRGRSDTSDELEKLARSDRRGYGAILRRIDLLRKTELRHLLQMQVVKQPTATLYVLRVQSGPVSFRLPFFESPCHSGKLIVLTHCEHRSLLRGDRYKALIQAAERRREDWIRRNCKEVRT